jgi:hypothetical protein
MRLAVGVVTRTLTSPDGPGPHNYNRDGGDSASSRPATPGPSDFTLPASLDSEGAA